jgi:hypothetical protein
MSKTAEFLELRELVARGMERLERIEAAVAGIGHNGGPPLDEPLPPPKPEDEGKPVLLSDRRVAERYDVSVRTLARWDETAGLGFPPPIYIRDRRYRALAALEAWDRNNARKASTQIKPCGVAGRFAKTVADAAEAR